MQPEPMTSPSNHEEPTPDRPEPIVDSTNPFAHHETPQSLNSFQPQPAQFVQPRRSRFSFGSKLLQGISWYGLELVLSVIGLLVSWMVITYGIFALFNYLKGIDDPTAVQYVGEFSLWVGATMIVWLPLAMFFYIRSRNELARHPEQGTRLVHKIVVSFMLLHVVLAVAGLVFAVIFAVLRMALGMDDTMADTFVRVILPSLLAGVVAVGLVAAYNISRVSKRLFAIVFSTIAVLVVGTLLGISASSIQANDYDTKAVSDLTNIQSEISVHYSNKQRLPDTLKDVDSIDSATKNRLSRYIYKKDSSTHYQLCVTFKTDTTKQYGSSNKYGSDYTDSQGYATYASFSGHEKGDGCYKLTVSYSAYDYSNTYQTQDPQSMY